MTTLCRSCLERARREFERGETRHENNQNESKQKPPHPLSLCSWEESGRHSVDFLPKIIPAKELMRRADGAVSFPVKRIKEDSLVQLFLMARVVIFLICEKMFHLLLKLAPFT